MISLTYMSTAAAPLDTEQLEALLTVSREWNARKNVTGMLLYVDQHFIQTLEGDEQVVDVLMEERIRVDSRHHSIDVTLVESIEERSFEGWSMGFTTMDGDAVADLPGFTDFLDPRSEAYHQVASLGRAGKFHRAFRDAMPGSR